MTGLCPAGAQTKQQPPPDKRPAPVQLLRIRFSTNSDYTRVVADLARQVRYEFDQLGNPERVYVDLFDAVIGPEQRAREVPVGDAFLNRIRIEERASVIRLVLDLKRPAKFRVFELQDPPRLVVDLIPSSAAPVVTKASPKPPVAPPAGPTVSAVIPKVQPAPTPPVPAPPVPARELPAPKLDIVILDGEGAVHNSRERPAREPVIEVRDENSRPVPGVTVTFSLPESGPGGTFANDTRFLTVMTDEKGQAAARTLRPNDVAGKFEIQVMAGNQRATASATITQANEMAAIREVAAAPEPPVVAAPLRAPPPEPPIQPAAVPKIKIVIVEGDGGISNLKAPTARTIIVRVEDQNQRPVSGAVVNVSLPNDGAGGMFFDGGRTLSARTAEDGTMGFSIKPNKMAGKFQIRLAASFQGQTAVGAVAATNVTSPAASGGLSTTAVVVLLGGAAAAGLGARAAMSRSRGGGPSAPPPQTPTPTISIGVGSGPIVSPPR